MEKFLGNIVSGHCGEGIIYQDVMDLFFKISPKERIIEPFPKKATVRSKSNSYCTVMQWSAGVQLHHVIACPKVDEQSI